MCDSTRSVLAVIQRLPHLNPLSPFLFLGVEMETFHGLASALVFDALLVVAVVLLI